jgi:hypothetical protein
MHYAQLSRCAIWRQPQLAPSIIFHPGTQQLPSLLSCSRGEPTVGHGWLPCLQEWCGGKPHIKLEPVERYEEEPRNILQVS